MGQVIPEKPLRVVVWSTGTVGRHAIAGVDAHPDLELVGVWTSTPAKEGRDAGELAGLGRELGVALFEHAPRVVHEPLVAGGVGWKRALDLRRKTVTAIVIETRPVLPQQAIERPHRQELDVILAASATELEQLLERVRRGDDGRSGVEDEARLLVHVGAATWLVARLEQHGVTARRL